MCIEIAQVQPKAPWYEAWFGTDYYHQLYGTHDEREAADFVDALVAHLHPSSGARALDVGCGMGRHSRALAAHGLDVTGVDLSPSSIRQASRHATPTLRFHRHDMLEPFGRRYDYVFNFFTSFGYFEAEHHERVMRHRDAVERGAR
jgi:2-polyprenyl-3-methyl-5-hydroxy-6-metoxy-1,4-benzoquinol methylase